MTKDTIFFSGLAGVISNIFKELITWSFYLLGLIKYTYVHFCAGTVVNPAIYVKDPLAIMIGMIIDYTIAIVFSVAIYLVMRKTGTEHWLFKGLGFGMLIFMICYVILRPTFSLKIEATPLQVFLYIIPNLVYGVITCWFLKKYGTFIEYR